MTLTAAERVAEQEAQREAGVDRLARRWLVLYAGAWIFGGALRKWGPPGLAQPLYFVADAVTFGAFGLLLLRRSPAVVGRRLIGGLALLAALVLLGTVQILAGAVATATAVGVITYGSPAVALLLVSFVRDRERARRQVMWVILWSTPVQAGLAALQTFSPLDSVWNQVGATGDVGLSTADGVVRATGTFTAPVGLTAFVTVAAVAAFSDYASRRISLRSGLALASVLFLVSVGGSRGAILNVALVLIGLMLWSGSSLFRSNGGRSRLVTLIGAVVIGAVGVGAAVRFLPQVIAAFRVRIDQAGAREDPVQRILNAAFGYLGEPFSWVGDGIGSHTLAGLSAGSPGPWIELEMPRLVAEFGLLGLALAALRQLAAVFLLVHGVGAARRSNDPLLALVALPGSLLLFQGALFAPSLVAGAFVILAALYLLGRPPRATPGQRGARKRVTSSRVVQRVDPGRTC
ncbi:hypothetical protein K8Z61_10405 [Nocardioides sp. TRM66260-LWL]|uniref:hypothetical protein n=1 Tax=Nocardioides sp. TRM66260-LWL TaxID=2874478 RepID=UPI001CC670FC|nr:hypothetical protein [Nocardioides sp. TRM66260-LWL]MBZ5734907.1 hypothetical protein [Nocardioides sp. TRM66260-LWL]